MFKQDFALYQLTVTRLLIPFEQLYFLLVMSSQLSVVKTGAFISFV